MRLPMYYGYTIPEYSAYHQTRRYDKSRKYRSYCTLCNYSTRYTSSMNHAIDMILMHEEEMHPSSP